MTQKDLLRKMSIQSYVKYSICAVIFYLVVKGKAPVDITNEKLKDVAKFMFSHYLGWNVRRELEPLFAFQSPHYVETRILNFDFQGFM